MCSREDYQRVTSVSLFDDFSTASRTLSSHAESLDLLDCLELAGAFGLQIPLIQIYMQMTVTTFSIGP
jgi:hypothetical protein